MIIDNNVGQVGIAFGATTTVIDLGSIIGSKGEDMNLWIEGTGLTSCTGWTITDGPTAVPATVRATFISTTAELAAGPIKFTLPSNVQRYFKLTLVAAAAGTWSWGVNVDDSSQTNK